MLDFTIVSSYIIKNLKEADKQCEKYDTLLRESDANIKLLEYIYEYTCESTVKEATGKKLDKAYDKHNKLYNKYDSACFIRDNLKEAQEAYKTVLRCIDRANTEACESHL